MYRHSFLNELSDKLIAMGVTKRGPAKGPLRAVLVGRGLGADRRESRSGGHAEDQEKRRTGAVHEAFEGRSERHDTHLSV